MNVLIYTILFCLPFIFIAIGIERRLKQLNSNHIKNNDKTMEEIINVRIVCYQVTWASHLYPSDRAQQAF